MENWYLFTCPWSKYSLSTCYELVIVLGKWDYSYEKGQTFLWLTNIYFRGSHRSLRREWCYGGASAVEGKDHITQEAEKFSSRKWHLLGNIQVKKDVEGWRMSWAEGSACPKAQKQERSSVCERRSLQMELKYERMVQGNGVVEESQDQITEEGEEFCKP